MRTFFDASALVKRYVDEPGSQQVDALCAAATEVAVSVICLPECISALCRLRREGVLDKRDYARAKTALLEDLEDIVVCNVTPAVVAKCVSVLESDTLFRTLDAIHIGCAVEWAPDAFVTSDSRQVAGADWAKLEVIEL